MLKKLCKKLCNGTIMPFNCVVYLLMNSEKDSIGFDFIGYWSLLKCIEDYFQILKATS